MDNIDPKLCYRDYVLQESDSITMEEAERGYEKCISYLSFIQSYCRRQQYKNAMAFFDSFANQEWLVESYVPSAHKEYLRAQQAEHVQEARRLIDAIASGALFIDPTTVDSSAASASASTASVGTLSHGSCIKDAFAERCV